jgi:hypothetical protein
MDRSDSFPTKIIAFGLCRAAGLDPERSGFQHPAGPIMPNWHRFLRERNGF